jgi:DNA-binding NtrC family response regulator
VQNSCVLVSGPLVCKDENLILALKKFATVLTNCNSSKIKSFLNSSNISVIILELANGEPNEVRIIEYIKTQFRNTKIILINGDRDLFVKAFSLGANDAFRKPYRRDLLVQRVIALLE